MKIGSSSLVVGKSVTILLLGISLNAGSILSGEGNEVHKYSDAVVAGGKNNSATGENSSICGGYYNLANSIYSTVGGGEGNRVQIAQRSVIAGGSANQIYMSGFSFIGGGLGNNIDSHLSHNTIAGGRTNRANGYGTSILGGVGNWTKGYYSVVPGGIGNHAWGNNSFAFGRNAWMNGEGSVLFTDNDEYIKTRNETKTFIGVFSNGYLLFTDRSGDNGVSLKHGDGAWNMSADINNFENSEEINGTELLDALSQLSIYKWNYALQGETVKHVAPSAEEFNTAFGLNDNNVTHINALDIDGVALKAIQSLYLKLQALQNENKSLVQRLEALETQLGN